jgi:hypothetical protein
MGAEYFTSKNCSCILGGFSLTSYRENFTIVSRVWRRGKGESLQKWRLLQSPELDRKSKHQTSAKKEEKIATNQPVRSEWKIFEFKRCCPKRKVTDRQASLYSSVQSQTRINSGTAVLCVKLQPVFECTAMLTKISVCGRCLVLPCPTE